jgi:Right handed beta helix region
MCQQYLCGMIVLLLLAPCTTPLARAAASPNAIEVAPDGNDAATAGAVATLERAVEIARARPADQPRRIVLRHGVFTLSRTLQLTAADSGLSIEAAPDQHPVLRGGRSVTGFVPWKGSILKAKLAMPGDAKVAVRQLFFNGQRQHLARFPNFDPDNPYGGGWSYVDGQRVSIYAPLPDESKSRFHYKPQDVHDWSRPGEAEVFIFPRYNWWNNLLRVRAIDPAAHTIDLSGEASYTIRPGDRYFVQNVLEELAAPGEWYFDRRDDTLYFWPPAPIRADNLDAVCVPTIENMIDARGASDIRIAGLTLECADGNAVALTDCTGCRVERCTIRNVGAHADSGNAAVKIEGGHDCVVAGNDIYGVGGDGIFLSGGDRKTLTPSNHAADNNYIHNTGVYYKQGVGVQLHGVGNRATHNLIHDTPRMGILFMGNNLLLEFNHIRHVKLETADTGAVYTGGRDWISSRGTVIRYNYFHDSLGFGRGGDSTGDWESPHFSWGVYLDDNTGGVDVIGNVIARCQRALVHLHNGRDNHIENNILIDGTQQQFECNGWRATDASWTDLLPSMTAGYELTKGQPAWRTMRGMTTAPAQSVLPDGMIMTGNTFRRNIVLYHDPAAKLYQLNSNVPLDHLNCDENIIWRPNPPVAAELEQWKARGLDRHSVLADPLLVDPAHDDYHLRADSPAVKLGFEPIPLERIGPYRDERRASWPIIEAEGAREHPLRRK